MRSQQPQQGITLASNRRSLRRMCCSELGLAGSLPGGQAMRLPRIIRELTNRESRAKLCRPRCIIFSTRGLLMRKLLTSLFTVFFLAWCQGPTAEITGAVTDSTGAVIAGAAITIVNIATNV